METLQKPRKMAQCSGSVKVIDMRPWYSAKSGTIYSPGYPLHYGTNKDCKWRIIAPYGQKVLIYFTFVQLEYISDCVFDSVQIFDGSSDSYFNKLLTKACSDRLPLPVYSSDQYIYMRFKSDGSNQGEGFAAHYKALNDSSGCPSIDPTATAGVIYSPNFPWNYGNGVSCNWTITSSSWKTTYLNFTQFSLQSATFYTCDADYVEVRYHYHNKKFCGSTIPSSIFTYGTIYFKFFSDYGLTYPGFMLFYQIGYTSPATTYPPTIYPPYTVEPTSRYGACSPYSKNRIFVGSSSSSSIASPNYYYIHHTSSPGVTCSWDISTPNSYILQLTFDKMSISSCSECSCGYVEVRDGSTSSDPILGRYCNGSRPSLVSSKGSQMFVKYYGKYSSDSFRATVRSKKVISAVTVKAVKVDAIVVPIVVAVVLFAIIFTVIIAVNKRLQLLPSYCPLLSFLRSPSAPRSEGPAGSSGANEVPLQPLP